MMNQIYRTWKIVQQFQINTTVYRYVDIPNISVLAYWVPVTAHPPRATKNNTSTGCSFQPTTFHIGHSVFMAMGLSLIMAVYFRAHPHCPPASLWKRFCEQKKLFFFFPWQLFQPWHSQKHLWTLHRISLLQTLVHQQLASPIAILGATFSWIFRRHTFQLIVLFAVSLTFLCVLIYIAVRHTQTYTF